MSLTPSSPPPAPPLPTQRRLFLSLRKMWQPSSLRNCATKINQWLSKAQDTKKRTNLQQTDYDSILNLYNKLNKIPNSVWQETTWQNAMENLIFCVHQFVENEEYSDSPKLQQDNRERLDYFIEVVASPVCCPGGGPPGAALRRAVHPGRSVPRATFFRAGCAPSPRLSPLRV